jgi:thiol-disulfide isomerase/thioredoxin
MRRAALALAAVATATLTACGGSDTAATDAPPGTPAPSSPAADSAATSGAASPTAAPATASGFVSYADYQAAKAAHDAGTVVFFFNASWCPSCKRTVANLEADPAAIADDLTIVSVDYDSSGDLKQRYGVTYQHTFVQVDADGEQLAKWSGSETAEAIAAKTV